MIAGCFLLANWGGSLHLTIQTTGSFNQGHVASLHYIPSTESSLSGTVQQTFVTDGKPPSLTRFHKGIQKLNNAERPFLSKQHKVIFWGIKYTIKNSQEKEETEDFYLSALFF